MPKVIVMNMGTEQMMGQSLTSTQHLLSAKSSWRNAWFADVGDVILSRVQFDEDFLNYIGNMFGFDPKSVSVITPGQEQSNSLALTDELLLSSNIVDALRHHTAGHGSWTILPCFCTEGVAELAFLLGFEKSIGLDFAAQRGCDLLNRKAHFRQLAVGAGLPLADGSVTHSPERLANAIRKHLPQTGTVIIKKDNGAGGMGNLTVTSGDVTPLPGSRETRKAWDDLDAMAAQLWGELTDRWNHVLVVESYYNASQRFYVEYFIYEDGSHVFLNSGTIRLRPDLNPKAQELVWIGLEIPAELPSFSFAEVLSFSARFVTLAAQIGYRGHINIDAILTETNELFFNEVNARWGGGSVLHTVAERLLDTHYANQHVVSSLRDVKSPSLGEALWKLRERNLHFSAKSREGVLILACDESFTRTMECLIIAPSRTRVREIESLLLEAMAE